MPNGCMTKTEGDMRLEVRDQIRLSFKRLLEVCLDSISYRLMRSIVTVVIIVLAIAFLAVIVVEGYLGRSIRDAVLVKTRGMTAYTTFLRKVTAVEADEKLVEAFSQLRPGGADFSNMAGWGGMTETEAPQFVASSRSVNTYLKFFGGMSLGYRVRLVGQKAGLDIFDWVAVPANLASFTDNLSQWKNLRLPGGTAEFEKFLAAWPGYRDRFVAIKADYAATIRKIAEYCGTGGVGGKLRKAVGDNQAARFFNDIAARGFHVEKAEEPAILEGLAYQGELDWAYGQLNKIPIRTGWNRQYDEVFNPNSALESCVRSSSRIGWIQRALAEKREDRDFDAARMRRIAGELRYRSRMIADEQRLVGKYGQTVTLSQKTLWLIFVSFLVCVVGIANAMLMSVLERFKEIATMKCLGARNQTIAFLFVTESVIIGIVGGVAGIIVGFLVVMGRLTLQYRLLTFSNFPVTDVLVTFAACFLCSLLLAAVAAIYPAWVASRMAPMEAMRVD